MSGLTRDDVARLADLARIDLSTDELDALAGDLDHIVDTVATITDVVSGGVPATSHPIPMTNVTRPDTPRPSLEHDAALAGAPDADEGRFRVPRILDEE